MAEIIVRFQGGRASFVYDRTDANLAPLCKLGPVDVRRASDIVPADWRRPLFVLLRRAFGERGRVAAWTRTWPGPWRVDMSKSGGPDNIGVYAQRADALAAERAWIRANMGI